MTLDWYDIGFGMTLKLAAAWMPVLNSIKCFAKAPVPLSRVCTRYATS